jgi:hypothetical protein
MGCMKSSRFARLSAISAGLCVLLVALWIRSFYVVDVIHMPTSVGETSSYWHSARGTIRYARIPDCPTRVKLVWVHRTSNPSDVVYGVMRDDCFGFALQRVLASGPLVPEGRLRQGWRAGAPFWFLVVLTAILPIKYLLRRRRISRSRSSGQCQVCGYDLRATPNRCPECGAARVR